MPPQKLWDSHQKLAVSIINYSNDRWPDTKDTRNRNDIPEKVLESQCLDQFKRRVGVSFVVEC